MSAKECDNQACSSSLPDEGKVIADDEDKIYTGDSGFISGEIMRLDSGDDLADTLSILDIKSDNYNNLSKGQKLHEEEEPSVECRSITESTTSCDDLWKQYFQQDEDGDTFLHLAIAQGFIEAVLALIRLAPHPLLLDTPNDCAQTPVHLAAALGHWRILRWLIIAGAKPGPRNAHGDSPLHLAARNGDMQCCKALTEPVRENERLALGLSYPKHPYHELDLDQWNYEGQTSIHVAAIGGHIDVLRHLVWYGGDINAREGRQGYTALHYAVEHGNERLAYFLLRECGKLDTDTVTYGGSGVLQMGFEVSGSLSQALTAKGAAPPFDTDDSDDYSSGSDELTQSYNNSYSLRNMIGTSA